MSNRVSGTAARENSAKGVLLEWPKRRMDPDVRVYCAYNPSRESFLCSFVETVDVMPEKLHEHLGKLTPGSHKAVWLVPFRGIDANQVNAPIDLIFLDQNYCVLAMTQSFPNSHPGSCNWPVGSAIALPHGSIAASGTLAGDQVILCSPQKMKRRFSELQKSTEADREPETLSHNAYSVSHSISSQLRADVRISTWDDLLKQTRHGHSTIEPAVAATKLSDPHKMTEQQAWSKNWLFCLLAPHRKEKRKSPRESLPWVAGYFFTGGTPAPATICNISSLGMYVKTSERWSPGTMVQVALSDWRLPATDQVVTVNAMAVRSDDLGVGLRFVFPKPRRGKAADEEDVATTGITREQLREFLQKFKGKSRHFNWHQKIFD
ncbi:MAG TPA: hypothetical protein VFP40_07260 [Terriglobales bacterium]|nr:hypothetical protein [Terriglobales bacterium]